ncbi:hypothetical protein PPTG_07113 [Phytophthora nicotianae INRA-310]|uniref:Ty3 transposon capsid-like protein domain-containing protein n=1 Tax=Phytophthora nicotianae (strain INRA-310) TaxID=761204 RepID=W2QP37_PHYN3|nr:hypothetical protein PPTG_07113 [Phytophthora nicotianae INRA-310]ETN14863.1 hypothetical protein PPTG_07113 [Phytophthora nicotianae INRA-310]
MSPSYADNIDKLVEDNYFHWEFNVWMKLAWKGLFPQIIKPDLTYQVYVRGALTAAEAWATFEEHFNKKTLNNRLLVTKKLNNFKMKPCTKFASHFDQFKEIVLHMESISESLYETRQLVLLLGSLTDEYKLISTVLESTPNVTLAYVIQAFSGVQASDESSSAQEKAFATKKKDFGGKLRFKGKCFY